MTGHYKLKNIRLLLEEGFTDEVLRRLCYDEPEFRPVYSRLTRNTNKVELITYILAHAVQNLQVETLLVWARKHSPVCYEQYQPYHSFRSTSTTTSTTHIPQNNIINNPYTERAMITDTAMFFGRTEELVQIFSRLANFQSYSIIGQRRIGKSSLLSYICQPEVYYDRVPNPIKCTFAYIDLQTTGKPTQERFFSLVLHKFSQASAGLLATDYPSTYDGFRRFIEDSHDADWGLILCLDEFEVICGRGEFDTDFFAFLRGLGNSYNLAYVTASCSTLHKLCHRGQIASSQFWNIFTNLHLGLMSEEEARELVTLPFSQAGLALSEAEINFVLRLADRHPLLLQIACCHLFEAKLVGSTDYVRVEAKFRQETAPYLGYIFNAL